MIRISMAVKEQGWEENIVIVDYVVAIMETN